MSEDPKAETDSNDSDGNVNRMERLMPYVRAREASERTGEKNALPLSPDVEKLAEALGVSASWINARVRLIAAQIGSANVTAAHFAVGKSDGGKGGSRLEEDVDAALIKSVKYACGECGLKPGTTLAINTVLDRLRSFHQIALDRLPTRKKVAECIRSSVGIRAYAGPYAESHLNRPAEAKKRPDAMMTSVVLDWTGFSEDSRELIALTDDYGLIGRVILISALEEDTRIPWSWLWCACSPNSDLIGECIQRGLTDKTPLLKSYGLDQEYPIGGRPLILRHDNGRDLAGNKAQLIIKGGGIRCNECSPPNTPHYNGIVERFHRTAKGQFLDYLMELKRNSDDEAGHPEHRKSSLQKKKIYVLWSKLEQHWVTWLWRHYLQQRHGGLDEQTPLERYAEHVNGKGFPMHGVRKPLEETPELRWEFLARKKIHHFKGQIEIEGRKYAHAEVSANFAGRKQASFEVRWNRFDLTRVYVRHPATAAILTVPIVDPIELVACSRWEWESAISDLKRVNIMKPTGAEVAKLIKARKDKIANPLDRSNTAVINQSDVRNHVMHRALCDRFSRCLEAAQFTSHPAPGPDNHGVGLLESALVPPQSLHHLRDVTASAPRIEASVR